MKENFSLNNLTDRLNKITFSSRDCVGQLSKIGNKYKLCIYEHVSAYYTKKRNIKIYKKSV